MVYYMGKQTNHLKQIQVYGQLPIHSSSQLLTAPRLTIQSNSTAHDAAALGGPDVEKMGQTGLSLVAKNSSKP